ncbi:beta-lactamase family protein [Cellulomonas sp. APG4]|uniref:serine hydrolase domain-containing protein n=1 Tax=Cellulomonas sp. APG4 TaxID=1538656 RepID=UPI00137AF6CC|nr:serine hydrolase domain-containing protein [Cellulomonas sp. APG4]NCT91271.1 beta-lactamase family protein [Cellulomonas sp. APG4]
MPGRRRLPRARPRDLGVDARAIGRFLDAVEQDGPELHSLMVLREGTVVAEGWWDPYRPDELHDMFSVTKAFAATAFGLARDEGLLDLDDLVLDHLGDLAPAQPDERLRRMRLRHLLTMTSGHPEGVHAGLFELADWDRGAMALPVANEPGTSFAYSSACTYLLGLAVQRATGERMLDYLRPRLLEPLGMTGLTWDTSPSGHDNGGFGLRATTEDLACLGQLYLDAGRWDGAQVLPEEWVHEALAQQVPSHIDGVDWAQGYGFGFWRCRHGAVRADGAFGQFSVLLPDQRGVVAITSGTADLQGVLDLVWEHLLPAFGPPDGAPPAGVRVPAVSSPSAGEREPAVSSPSADEMLAARLGALRLAPPQAGPRAPERVPDLSTAVLELDEPAAGVAQVRVTQDADGVVTALELRTRAGTRSLAVGHGTWAAGTLPWVDGEEHPVALAGAWTADGVHETHVRWVRTPSCLVLRTTVPTGAGATGDDGVRVEPGFTVRFHGPAELPTVTGRAVPAG